MRALPARTAVRYGTPLREGGSLPAIVEADDGRLYVAKFAGAGQGTAALVAEIVAGTLARAAGLRVPELVTLDVDAAFGRTEADPEIRDLLAKSAGLNLGVAFLAGAVGFDPAARVPVPGALASLVVAFDAFAMNVDRTVKNPNLLWCRGDLWLIDHGAAFYWHHDWDGSTAGAERPFALIRDHVLLPAADALGEAGARLADRLTDDAIDAALALVPDAWLTAPAAAAGPAARRAAYAAHLRARRAATPSFIEEAVRARAQRV
jgi:HipA-like protein